MLTNDKTKKMIAVLGLCLVLSSCGGDNKSEAPAAPAVAPAVEVKPTEITNSAPLGTDGIAQAETFDQLKQHVAAGNFFVNTNAANYNYVSYNFSKCNNSKGKFLGIFTTYTNSCPETFIRAVSSGTIIREDGFSSRQAIIDDLMSKLNSITPVPHPAPNATVYKISPSNWQFVHNNSIYSINFSYPLEANPVYKSDMTSGEYYTFTNWYGANY